MKIGILTLPLHTNYGGILQAYALQTILERMGHNVVVIDKSRYKYLPVWKAPFVYVCRLFKNIFLKKKIGIRYEKYYNNCLRRDEITQQYTRPFIEKHIRSLPINSFKELQESDYEAIVVGSDQIWRTIYTNMLLDSTTAAYLDFAKDWKNLKRVAYAVSFGTDVWEYSNIDTKKCRKLIKKFDAVSVRENDGVEKCRKYLNYEKVVHVLDPTFLLESCDYMKLVPNEAEKSKGSLLCYIMDLTTEKQELINRFAKIRDLVPFSVNSKVDDWSAPMKERIQPSVEQWLKGFHDAEFVITDSFHACVFSIIFKKQFIVVGNVNRGLSRFESLLGTFGLMSRMISSDSNIEEFGEIDFDVVYGKLDDCKKKSIEFLKEALNGS